MATMNPFDLLGDDDTEDLSIAAQKAAAVAAAAKKQQPASLAKSAKQAPSRTAPPVRDGKNDVGGRGGSGGGRGSFGGRGGGGRGRGGLRRDFAYDENSTGNTGFPAGGQGAPEDGESGRNSERRGGYAIGGRGGGGRGGRRSGFSNGDVGDGERPRRPYERRSGTGRGNEIKREGSGRGNWGSENDEFSQVTEEVKEFEKNEGEEKPAGEGDAVDGDKESPTKESEEKVPEEDKEMTLEEYQKKQEEKRKALQATKTEERKVDVKEFESMQQLSNKKDNDDVFIKLGSDKDKRKDAAEKDERAKKAVNITEFLKPAEGERYYNPSGGRRRGDRGQRGDRGGNNPVRNVSAPSIRNVPLPSIEDQRHFPTLGAK